jgi:hypothetical protein
MTRPPARLSVSIVTDEFGRQASTGLEERHLVKGARDAHSQRAEVDRDRVRFHPDDATHAVLVVIDQVAAIELLDDRLGVRLEGAAGEISTPCGQGCHYCQYAPDGYGKNSGLAALQKGGRSRSPIPSGRVRAHRSCRNT